MMTGEGMASMGFASITTSGFLAAFALALGATNLQIGILAAIPFIMQPLQIPAILLVERLGQRKALTVSTWLVAQLLWLPIALIPVLIRAPGAGAISMLLSLMAVRGAISAVTNCAWNPWVRDLVPQDILGRFFSRRLALSTAVAVVFGLGAALFVDYWKGQAPAGDELLGYTFVLLFGATFLGLASPAFMSLMPEPMAQPPMGPRESLWRTLATPFRDSNFRHLMRFLLVWTFALNLATPFFAVYMLQRLGLPLFSVIGFSVIAQLTNILFLRVWGPLADRFGAKAVLSLSASLYLLVILGWTFTTMPERYFLTIPLLVILHIFAGVATAGVSLTVGTIGLKLAPRGQATPYLAGASLATNLGAGIGPFLGGVFADYFKVRQLSFDFTFVGPTRTIEMGMVSLTGYDFLFAITFVIGLISLNTLTTIREEGEAGREVVLGELMSQSPRVTDAVSSVPGLRFISAFPFAYLRRVPGMDVAIGVTGYQLADVARRAVLAATQSRRTTSTIAGVLETGLSQIWQTGNKKVENSSEASRQAARGVAHALRDTAMRTPARLMRPALAGVIRGLFHARADPLVTFRGTGYGAVQGAGEAGIGLSEATASAVAAARDTAGTVHLDQATAVSQVAEGALAAAAEMGSEAVTEVTQALSREAKRAYPGSALSEDHRGDAPAAS